MNDALFLTRWKLAEWMRSKAYLGSIVAGVFLVIAAPIISELAAGEDYRVFADIGVMFCTSVSTISITALVISSISRDLNGGSISTVCVRSVSRSSIIVSYILSACVAATASNILLGALLAATSASMGDTQAARIFAACIFSTLEAGVVSAIAVAVSSASSGSTATTITALFFVLGRVASATLDIKGNRVLDLVRAFLPRLDVFHLGLREDSAFGAGEIALRAGYGALWLLLAGLLAVLRFRSRDVN